MLKIQSCFKLPKKRSTKALSQHTPTHTASKLSAEIKLDRSRCSGIQSQTIILAVILHFWKKFNYSVLKLYPFITRYGRISSTSVTRCCSPKNRTCNFHCTQLKPPLRCTVNWRYFATCCFYLHCNRLTQVWPNIQFPPECRVFRLAIGCFVHWYYGWRDLLLRLHRRPIPLLHGWSSQSSGCRSYR